MSNDTISMSKGYFIMSEFSMRIDAKLKEKTQKNFKKMGLDMSTATKMFFTFVNQHGYLPFIPTTGKTELEQAIEEANKGHFSRTYKSVAEFKNHLRDEDKNN